MKIKISATLCAFLCTTVLYAQGYKRPESYNYQRGVEAVENENIEEALNYLSKDLNDNPKNGYSYSWIAYIRLGTEEYGKALSAANLAIKYLPKKDKEYTSFAYTTRGLIYLSLEDTTKALSDYTSVIRIAPDDADNYERRAQIYYEQDKYDLSDADYRKMTEIDPGDVMGYMGLGRNALEQDKLDDAMAQFNHVIKLNDSYSSGYSYRAEAEMKKEMWDAATTDIVAAMQCDWDSKAVRLMTNDLNEPALTMMLSKLKIQAVKSPNDYLWPYLIGIVYDSKEEYKKAIEQYKEANKRNSLPITYDRISKCYYMIGIYDEAINNINQALNMDSTDLSFIRRKADILYDMGNINASIVEWDKIMVAAPEYGWGYYSRGYLKMEIGNVEGAIEDLSMSIAITPDVSYAYVARGNIYQKQGNTELAKADYQKIIEIENSPELYDRIPYAYQGLGEYDKAIAAQDTIIARSEKDELQGNYYDAACLYSRMNDKENSLKYLEKALEAGYINFAHIERDTDLDFVREADEFKALIDKYKSIIDTKVNSEDVILQSKETITTEVPFTKDSGVCKVKCSVNGLPLHFIFDTGASDVTISMVEATFMLKNGYLDDNDVVGSQRYMDANGNVSVGTTINLKEVNFGGLNLTNVRASVVRNQKAPLLLGQTVLGRLGKIEIDNSANVLKITHNK